MKRSSRVRRSYERSELEKAGQVSHRAQKNRSLRVTGFIIQNYFDIIR